MTARDPRKSPEQRRAEGWQERFAIRLCHDDGMRWECDDDPNSNTEDKEERRLYHTREEAYRSRQSWPSNQQPTIVRVWKRKRPREATAEEKGPWVVSYQYKGMDRRWYVGEMGAEYTPESALKFPYRDVPERLVACQAESKTRTDFRIEPVAPSGLDWEKVKATAAEVNARAAWMNAGVDVNPKHFESPTNEPVAPAEDKTWTVQFEDRVQRAERERDALRSELQARTAKSNEYYRDRDQLQAEVPGSRQSSRSTPTSWRQGTHWSTTCGQRCARLQTRVSR